ncbi:copia protein [Tanacetum coccineum]|uniref:Copia protein n=1 Tax=Tanacetum coccineum TaxID=301880 RepID=A0ABQ4X5R1_9ASTR
MLALDQLNAEAESVQIILTEIDNDIYSTVDACPNACEMWKAIERLKQGESINVQDLETNLYWEFGKFTSRDGESLKSYYSRFYKMMNKLVRNQCDVRNHQVNVQFLLQLQPEWQRSQQAVTRNRGKTIVNSPPSTYDQEPIMVTEDDEMSKGKEIDKLMALISLSFKKIYKPTNNNLRTLSNTSRATQDNSPRINKGTGYDNQRVVNVAGARDTVDQADWKDDTDDESDDQELEAHYIYMAQLQEVTPDPVDNSGPIFDDEPMHKVQNNNDNYNVFAIENEHPEQPESSNDIYLAKQGDTNITIDSLDICYDRVQDDQDDTDDLDQERDLLASLIQKLKCEIDDSKNRNKFLESSNKELVDKLKGEIEDFKTKNKSLESSNNHFKEANNELSKTNQLMFKDLKKFQAELDKYNDVNYASKVEIDCAKAKGDLMSYKIDFEKSSNAYTQKINDLNQTISDMKKELCAHQETISIMSQAKEAQIKLYKTREDKELDKVIALENKVKVLNDIVYKTGQSVQTMNMLNRNCKTSFAKPEFLKKAQRANPRLYDIGCYNDNLALMLAPDSDETIRLEKERRSKLSDLIRPFDYDQRRQPQVRQTSIESSNLEKPDNPPIVTMADNRTMAQLLEAPTEGYEDAIVIPEITANNFEIKHGLLNLVPNVPNTSVKLMLFPFSLEGAARIWLEKEPPRSIETWDDLVSKFINKFFPPSKTTNLINEIMRIFSKNLMRRFMRLGIVFNDLLRGCPHHGFSELHQLDTFYNALNSIDQRFIELSAVVNS